MPDPPSPPEGTIALLFTDIEGSTRLAASLGPEWPAVLADHHKLVGGAIAAEGGFIDGTEGDAFFATFVEAAAATRAAVAALRGLRAHAWPADVGELAVRMGLHVGYVERRATGYVGLEVHRAARVAAAAHGGQLLLTGAARALIGEEVRVEPLGAHRLKDFPSPEALFCAVVDGRGAADFPAPRTEELRPTNLPAGAPRLVGRDDDLERTRRALMVEDERLVTLTGRGGVGKTTLAVVLARELLEEHPGGVWLVSLATSDDVLAAVASAIGAEGDASLTSLETIIARLRERGRVLLVLDNFEHLTGAAPALMTLLDALPELRILVTSQVPLRVSAEYCVQLGALDQQAALALIERVARRRGAVPMGNRADREALEDVVDLLDGLPLGLELAAARLALLSPAQLRDRLRESQDVLTDAGAHRPDRQRSLRATAEWTLGLLDEGPRSLFVRMGAFAGPVELEDLEAVAAGDGLDVLDALAGLLDVALIRRVESGDGRVRFGLPEALRQIASGLLEADPDSERWRRAHAQRQRDIVWAARVLSVPADVFRKAVAADPEARLALRWAQETGDPLAAPLAAARAMVAADTGHCREALASLDGLLDRPTGEPDVDALVLTAHAFVATILGRVRDALALVDRAVAAGGGPETRAYTLVIRGLIRTYCGDPEQSVRDCELATSLARDLGPAALAGALAYESQARIFAGELDRAAEQLTEAERIGTPVDAKALWHIDTMRGDVAALSGRFEEALGYQLRSLEAAQARSDELQVLHDLAGTARSLLALGEVTAALEVAGLTEAQAADVQGPTVEDRELILRSEELDAADSRLEPGVAAEMRARGTAVPAGNRVTRAIQLARAAHPVDAEG